MKALAWLILASVALLVLTFVVLLPAYTLLLAAITMLRATRRRRRDDGTGATPAPWSRVATSFFRGTVFHVRHRPVRHAFAYPLYFAVVDLDEAADLFGGESVRPPPAPPRPRPLNPKGQLWPLSSLMLLRDEDHLKNAEGVPAAGAKVLRHLSTRERIFNLVHERTGGRLDLRSTKDTGPINPHDVSKRRRILLVTHLMYYGYCFNPVSFYFILKPKTNDGTEDEAEDIEAVVVEISNTPWLEMSVYVLHPDSVDTLEHSTLHPADGASHAPAKTQRYRMCKTFHVSPFMNMDHDYDWQFQISRDRIKVEIQLIRNKDGVVDAATPTVNGNGGDRGVVYFTGGFVVRRTARPTATYPLQLARVICRFPVYCFVIQVWIHYEAVRLLWKGVAFVPHPEGSETGASRAIAAAMRPVFAAMEVADAGWRRWQGRGKSKVV